MGIVFKVSSWKFHQSLHDRVNVVILILYDSNNRVCELNNRASDFDSIGLYELQKKKSISTMYFLQMFFFKYFFSLRNL